MATSKGGQQLFAGKNRRLGVWGEDQACAFLCRQAFEIVERNYFSPVGELDIVAKKGDDFYFVEVKTRQVGEMANDLAITLNKKFKLQKTVKRYCYERGIGEAGLILASLLVVVEPRQKKVVFRLTVLDPV